MSSTTFLLSRKPIPKLSSPLHYHRRYSGFTVKIGYFVKVFLKEVAGLHSCAGCFFVQRRQTDSGFIHFKRGAEIPCRFLKVSSVRVHSFPAAIDIITATRETGLLNCVLIYASSLRSERRRYKTRKITKV